MDDAVGFGDIYGGVDGFMGEGFEPENALALVATAKTAVDGLLVTVGHTRELHTAEGSMALDYAKDGWACSASLNHEGTMGASLSVEDPLGYDGTSVGMEAGLENGGDLSLTASGERKTNGWLLSVQGENEGGSDVVMVTNALTMAWRGFKGGVQGLFDGKKCRFVNAQVAASQTADDLEFAFTLERCMERAEVRHNFGCGFTFPLSEQTACGANLSKESGAKPEFSAVVAHSLDDSSTVRFKASTSGLYAIAVSVLLAANLSLSFFVQQHFNAASSVKGGLTISYDRTGDDTPEADGSAADEAEND